jgi:thiol-disulfide isomerase/thioredoxin
MNKFSYQTIFRTRIAVVSTLLLLSLIAVPQTMAQELPKPNGAGDVPDMMIDLVPMKLGPVASRASRLNLSSLRGRVVLIDMFWSKCPHCEEHAPHMINFYNQYRQRGFIVLGLATDRQDKKEDVESVKAFLTRTKINYPVGFLTNEVMANYADANDRGVPQMVLFGPDGKMVKRLIGWDDKKEKELRQAIEAQLAKLSTTKARR